MRGSTDLSTELWSTGTPGFFAGIPNVSSVGRIVPEASVQWVCVEIGQADNHRENKNANDLNGCDSMLKQLNYL